MAGTGVENAELDWILLDHDRESVQVLRTQNAPQEEIPKVETQPTLEETTDADVNSLESSVEDLSLSRSIETVQECDTDLSFCDDLPLDFRMASPKECHYRHCRNNRLNFYLDITMALMVATAVGLGTGHWIGWSHKCMEQEQRLSEMRGSLYDDVPIIESFESEDNLAPQDNVKVPEDPASIVEESDPSIVEISIIESTVSAKDTSSNHSEGNIIVLELQQQNDLLKENNANETSQPNMNTTQANEKLMKNFLFTVKQNRHMNNVSIAELKKDLSDVIVTTQQLITSTMKGGLNNADPMNNDPSSVEQIYTGFQVHINQKMLDLEKLLNAPAEGTTIKKRSSKVVRNMMGSLTASVESLFKASLKSLRILQDDQKRFRADKLVKRCSNIVQNLENRWQRSIAILNEEKTKEESRNGQQRREQKRKQEDFRAQNRRQKEEKLRKNQNSKWPSRKF